MSRHNHKQQQIMSKRRSSQVNYNPELDETFRFDSKMDCRKSRNKSGCSSVQKPHLDLSQTTSEVIRHAEFRNDNILELLEESEEEKRTNKGSHKKMSQLWDFFARFENQSNPDITISQIEVQKHSIEPDNHQSPFYPNPPKQKRRNQKNPEQKSQNSSASEENHQNSDSSQPRYPKRNRVGPLRYWLGEKCIYRNGKIVDIKRAGPRQE